MGRARLCRQAGALGTPTTRVCAAVGVGETCHAGGAKAVRVRGVRELPLPLPTAGVSGNGNNGSGNGTC